jgi:hypothetical protein
MGDGVRHPVRRLSDKKIKTVLHSIENHYIIFEPKISLGFVFYDFFSATEKNNEEKRHNCFTMSPQIKSFLKSKYLFDILAKKKAVFLIT